MTEEKQHEMESIIQRKKQRKRIKYNFLLQKIICDYYKLPINDYANNQFNANYDENLKEGLVPVIKKIFNKVGSKPVELLTFTDKITDPRETTSPHNFLLKNEKTLSIKIVPPSNNKIPPNTVGQASLSVLNDYFSDIYGKKIENQNDIKELVYNKIDLILPTFIDYFFISDYTVLISPIEPEKFEIINNNKIEYVSFSRDEFTFTQDLTTWNVSTTLKYHDISIAEIELPKNRSFNFRFIRNNLNEFIQEFNNETLGISAEAAICEIFNLEKPDSFATRASKKYIDILKPVINEAFITMPPAIEHSGSTAGERGGQSKCSYDFVLEEGLRLSLKTNLRNNNKPHMVCPPEVGQPGIKTCIHYFKDYLPEGTTEENLKTNFKQMVFDHLNEIIPFYVDYLFDSDWLLWIYEEPNGFEHKEISRASIMEYISDYSWKKENFTLTKKSVKEWKESCTVKYNDITIGEFQVHNNRNCFKFRFNMKKFLKLILNESQNV